MTKKKIAAFLIFFLCLAIGWQLSLRKLLWNDELYTQTQTIQPATYANIIRGELNEGNSYPLFYLIQKITCDVFKYNLEPQQNNQESRKEPKGQVILRLSSNVMMSAAIAVLFYFFVVNYGWLGGALVLIITFSSIMVWQYWVEARPYSLWFFLTVLQGVTLLNIYKFRSLIIENHLFIQMCVINLLLSLTVVFSIPQVAIVSILLVLKEFKPIRFLFLTVIPIAIGILYYFLTPKFHFWFLDPPIKLVLTCISVEQLVVIIFYAVLFFISQQKRIDEMFHQRHENVYLFYTGLVLMATWAIIIYLKINEVALRQGFAVNSRYFIYLTPVGIIAATVFFLRLWEFLKNDRWNRAIFVFLLTGMLIISYLKTFMEAYSLGLYS